MKKKKVWLCVFLWRGLLDDIRIAYNERGAEIIFKRHTGIRYKDFFNDHEEFDPADNWGGSEILQVRV